MPDDDILTPGEVTRHGISYGGAIVVVIVVLAVLGAAGWGVWSRVTANERGKTGVREQTKADANFRRGAHNSFYDLCSSVQTLDGSIQNTRRRLTATGADKPDASDRSRLNDNLDAQLNQRLSLATTYNAKSANYETKQFKSRHLPKKLPTTAPRKGLTKCTA